MCAASGKKEKLLHIMRAPECKTHVRKRLYTCMFLIIIKETSFSWAHLYFLAHYSAPELKKYFNTAKARGTSFKHIYDVFAKLCHITTPPRGFVMHFNAFQFSATAVVAEREERQTWNVFFSLLILLLIKRDRATRRMASICYGTKRTKNKKKRKKIKKLFYIFA